ncbi:uncharacterized protein LOC106078796 isoform X3 [Biomphalaria glabrata]|uniref:Uncharacterized protein LOC106078796 isoform X3 n=1 Tax=Biomphalaria glabrata TaxID=6526 RepID=A0A9U8EN13_BIOGL|nr:uncharacterized protein LOC106078796 isoform X3 [Biomphalaria glabrata]
MRELNVEELSSKRPDVDRDYQTARKYRFLKGIEKKRIQKKTQIFKTFIGVNHLLPLYWIHHGQTGLNRSIGNHSTKTRQEKMNKDDPKRRIHLYLLETLGFGNTKNRQRTNTQVKTSKCPKLHILKKTKSKQVAASEQGTSDSLDYEANPDIPSFQSGQFMSSTVLKKIPIAKRHMDNFGGTNDYGLLSRRGVMLHTDRYQLDFMKSMDSNSQRERLQAGVDYVESVRGNKRKKEMLPHRAEFDLIMGGKQIEFEERFDINREIQKLKAIAMPTHAKDLFHGRGIRLPSNHMSLHPRHPLPNDLEEELSQSAPNPFQHLPHRISEPLQHHLPRMFRDLTSLDRGMNTMSYGSFKKHPRLPSIPPRTESTADGSQQDPRISMFQERRTISNISARLGFQGRLHRDVIPLSRAQSQAPPPAQEQTIKQKNKLITRGVAEQMSSKKPIRNIFIHQARTSQSQEKEQTEGRGPSLSSLENRDTPENLNKSRMSNNFDLLEAEDDDSMDDKHQKSPKDTNLTEPQTHEEQELSQTFNRLNTGSNSYLGYEQLKMQLPKVFSEKQEKFMEEVYNMINSMEAFGIDEFMIMNQLSKTIESLSGKASEAFESIDLVTLPQELKKYVGQFQDNDTANTSKISIDSLRKILSATFSFDQVLWNKTLESISLDHPDQVSKSVYIAHIPFFLSLEKTSSDV